MLTDGILLSLRRSVSDVKAQRKIEWDGGGGGFEVGWWLAMVFEVLYGGCNGGQNGRNENANASQYSKDIVFQQCTQFQLLFA